MSRQVLSRAFLIVAVAIANGALFGCASDTPAPQRSTTDIKSDADKAFKDIKQEEREYRGERTPSR